MLNRPRTALAYDRTLTGGDLSCANAIQTPTAAIHPAMIMIMMAMTTATTRCRIFRRPSHAGFNGPEILADLQVHHDARYKGFSRLITATFDEALAHFSDASVVMLYLLPTLNLRLRPTLWKTLKPGTRVVSHDFDMGDWKPEQTLSVDGAQIYYWTITPDLAKKAAMEKQ